MWLLTCWPAGQDLPLSSALTPEYIYLFIYLHQMYDANELWSMVKVMTSRLVFKTVGGIERKSQMRLFQKDYIETFNLIQVEWLQRLEGFSYGTWALK